MKRFLAVLLSVLVTMPLPIMSQTINIFVKDWMMLKTELSISKQQLKIINTEVKNLEGSLEQARIEQQNSKTSIESSQVKIDDLEKQLSIAVHQQNQLQSIVNSLESQLIELGISLNDTQFQLNQNENKHIIAIKNLITIYERRIKIGKILLYTVVGIAIGEGFYILIDNLIK